MYDTPAPERTIEGTVKEILERIKTLPAERHGRFTLLPEEREEAGSLADSLKDLLEEAKNIRKDNPIHYADPQTQRVVEVIRDDLQRQGLRV